MRSSYVNYWCTNLSKKNSEEKKYLLQYTILEKIVRRIKSTRDRSNFFLSVGIHTRWPISNQSCHATKAQKCDPFAASWIHSLQIRQIRGYLFAISRSARYVPIDRLISASIAANGFMVHDWALQCPTSWTTAVWAGRYWHATFSNVICKCSDQSISFLRHIMNSAF